jgi:uncharacterized protein YecT (DUF1311 family)
MNVHIIRAWFAFAAGLGACPLAVCAVGDDKPPPVRASYDQCLDKSEGVTIAINNCIGTEYDFQDARLNTAYKALRATMSAEQRNALRDEERAWISDRDKTCAPPADGGTADMLGANECRMTRTAFRAAELEERRTQP